MTLDLVLTVLNVVWGLLLTGIGIEMVNNPPGESNQKKWAYRIAFVVFGAGVLITTVCQSVHSNSEQEGLRAKSEETERLLSNKVSEQGGKLDAIAHFEQQFLTFVQSSKPTEPDAAAKAYEAMAATVLRMAQPNAGVPANGAHLLPLYDGKNLSGQVIAVTPTDNGRTDSGRQESIQLAEFHFKNDGGRVTGSVSARLYLSKQINAIGWQPTQTDEPDFPYCYYLGGGGGIGGLSPVVINPGETWNWYAFGGQLQPGQTLDEPIRAMLKVFYGVEKPAEADFTIRKK